MPSIHVPSPEIISNGHTFSTYALNYTLFIKFFHNTTNEAHKMASIALNEILKVRNLIPIIDDSGNVTNRNLRIKDPKLKKLENSDIYQLQIDFVSIKLYAQEEVMMMNRYIIDLNKNSQENGG